MRATIITLETISRATKSANTQPQATILRIMRPPARNPRSSNVFSYDLLLLMICFFAHRKETPNIARRSPFPEPGIYREAGVKPTGFRRAGLAGKVTARPTRQPLQLKGFRGQSLYLAIPSVLRRHEIMARVRLITSFCLTRLTYREGLPPSHGAA